MNDFFAPQHIAIILPQCSDEFSGESPGFAYNFFIVSRGIRGVFMVVLIGSAVAFLALTSVIIAVSCCALANNNACDPE